MKLRLNREYFFSKKFDLVPSRWSSLVQRAWRTKYVCSTAPSWSTIIMIAKQFVEKTGSVINLQAKKRNTSPKRPNCQNILEKVMSEKPSLSIRKASQIAKISCSLTRLVLKNYLGLKQYKNLICMRKRQIIIQTHMYIILIINKPILILKNC